MYGNPREFTVTSDKEGFYIINEFEEEAEVGSPRYTSHKLAQERIKYLIDNDEPPDSPGWEGGFAENH